MKVDCRRSGCLYSRLRNPLLIGIQDMHTRTLLVLIAIAASTAVPSRIAGQQPGYPVTLIPPGKGPFTFPPGYQTPWEKIEIKVAEKMSANLFVLHGSRDSRGILCTRVERPESANGCRQYQDCKHNSTYTSADVKVIHTRLLRIFQMKLKKPTSGSWACALKAREAFN